MSELPNIVQSLQKRVALRLNGVARHAFSFAVGLLVALILHYLLYRIGLPSKPFIYVAF